MSRIALVAAMPGELEPLVHGWQPSGRNIWIGQIGAHPSVAVAGGMGANAATRACQAAGHFDALVSLGWAGALTATLQPRSACAVREVVDARTGERFVTQSAEGARLVTLDHVAHVEEKRRLADTYRADLVDMEAATVARLAAARQIPFYCFKAISDGPGERLPDFGRFLGANGQLRMPAFVAHALTHPRYWPALLRLGQNSKRAAEALGSLVRQQLEDGSPPHLA